MTKVAVLGAGMMATALATPLTDNGHEVHIVGSHLDRDEIESMREKGIHPRLAVRVPASVRAYQLEEAAAAFEDAPVVMVGVNSFGVRWAGEQLTSLLRPGQDVLAVAKGMHAEDDGTLRILPDVMAEPVAAELREAVTWSAVVGPSIAGEVAARRHTCVVFAGLDQAALIAQGFHELCRMLDVLGGRRETPYELPGIGDMYVTSVGGRNVKVGRLLGEGVGFTEASERLGNPTLEGAAAIRVIGGALPKLTERGIIGADDFPLLRHLHEVIALERPVDIPWSRFFRGEG